MAAKQKEIKAILRPLVRSLETGLGKNLIAIVLFGSRARGAARKTSDWDLFILARSLPSSVIERYSYLRRLCANGPEEGISFLAKTLGEFEQGFPSFYLDLALDGVILFDSGGYMQAKLKRIREITKQAGLRRERISGGFFWDWEKYPETEWEISWQGFEVK
jgi:uncharacterized protein